MRQSQEAAGVGWSQFARRDRRTADQAAATTVLVMARTSTKVPTASAMTTWARLLKLVAVQEHDRAATGRHDLLVVVGSEG